jgi:hypothetical protein
VFSRRGQGEDCWKEDTRTWPLGGRSVSNRKSAFFIIQEGTARAREYKINEKFYNACINGILKDRYPREKKPKLHHLKPRQSYNTAREFDPLS